MKLNTVCVILLILSISNKSLGDITLRYTREEGKRCGKNIPGPSYSTFTSALKACQKDRHCYVIEDNGCDNYSFTLCEEFEIVNMPDGNLRSGCIYRLSRKIVETNQGQSRWGTWSSYSSCSTTCGPGLRTRNRKCIDQILDGGNYCVGSASSTKDCYVQNCPGCKWSNWNEVANCVDHKSKGYCTQFFQRSKIIGETGQECTGKRTRYENCTCSVDISTVSISNCSTSCGEGILQTTVLTISGSSTNDFQVSNHFSPDETCYDDSSCPLEHTKQLTWSEWSTCTSTCIEKNNYPTRTRTQILVGKSGKNYNNTEKVLCSELQLCQTTYECPRVSITRYNISEENGLRVSYKFRFPPSEIPFGDIYKRDVVVILAPKSGELRPDMVEEEFTDGLIAKSVKRIEWVAKNDSVETIPLEINENFLVYANVYGEFNNPGKFDQNLTTNKTYITFRCHQQLINTLIFQCENGETISAANVCDIKQDCKDGSDENDSTCTVDLKIIWWLTIIAVLLSNVSYIISSLCQYFAEDKNKAILQNESISENDKEGTEKDALEKDLFSTIYFSCTKIQETLDEKDAANDKLKIFLDPVLDAYKTRHQQSNDPQRKELIKIFTILKNIALDPNFLEACNFVQDKLHELENKELHANNGEESGDCLKLILTNNHSTFDYILSGIERFGNFAKAKKIVGDLIASLVGRVKLFELGLRASLLLTLVFGLKEIFLYYYDVYLDTMIGAGLHHIEVNFVTSVEKSKLISHVEIGWIKYYFPSLNFLSMILIHIYYYFHIQTFSFHRPRLIFRFISTISLFFPVTFTVFEYFRACLKQTNLNKDIGRLMSVRENTKSGLNQKAEKYLRLSRSMDENVQQCQRIQRILQAFIIIETLVETLPQTVTIIVFLINDYQNSFGPLRAIFMETVVAGIDLKAQILSAMLIFINLSKLSFFSLGNLHLHIFPMSIGVPGCIIKLLESFTLLSSKIFLCSVIFRTAPYGFIVTAMIEVALVSQYSKITQTKVDFIFSVLPASFIPSLFDHRQIKPNFSLLKRFRGAWNCVIIHYSSLLFAYLPSYFFIYSFLLDSGKTYHSFSSMEILAFLAYVLSILPYLALLTIYHYFGRRSQELSKQPKDISSLQIPSSETLPLIELAVQSDDLSSGGQDMSKNSLNPNIFVCPIKPKESFMKENKAIIGRKIDEMNNK